MLEVNSAGGLKGITLAPTPGWWDFLTRCNPHSFSTMHWGRKSNRGRKKKKKEAQHSERDRHKEVEKMRKSNARHSRELGQRFPSHSKVKRVKRHKLVQEESRLDSGVTFSGQWIVMH